MPRAITPEPAAQPDALAALDLGSNSFHMVVAREASGELLVLDRLRERVALAEGLGDGGDLDDEVQQRALACLERFGQRLGGIPTDRVRAVGTATFRRLERGSHRFQRRAERALGVEVEILSGQEEARLVYLGVAHSVGDDGGRRLVVDIGGGSTECILGERFESECERSLSMGCIRWSQAYFDGGAKITRRRLDRAELDARLQLEGIEREFRERGWKHCIGSSGTILAIAELLQRQSWTPEGIDAAGLDRLADAMVEAESIDALELEGLKAERRPVLAGGVAILRAVFAGLGVEHMSTTKGSLREGVLYDLLGRIHHEDVRERSVASFARRFGVDEAQAGRVTATALALFDQAAAKWRLSTDDRRSLAWAAQLHEVGLTVAWLSYHKHGAYLIENADLPGFSRQGQALLALLVRGHRRRVAGEVLDAIDALEPAVGKRLRCLLLLLRLAVRLHRGRGAAAVATPELLVVGATVRLVFPAGSLASHPLTAADVLDEAAIVEPLGFHLQVV